MLEYIFSKSRIPLNIYQWSSNGLVAKWISRLPPKEKVPSSILGQLKFLFLFALHIGIIIYMM